MSGYYSRFAHKNTVWCIHLIVLWSPVVIEAELAGQVCDAVGGPDTGQYFGQPPSLLPSHPPVGDRTHPVTRCTTVSRPPSLGGGGYQSSNSFPRHVQAPEWEMAGANLYTMELFVGGGWAKWVLLCRE